MNNIITIPLNTTKLHELKCDPKYFSLLKSHKKKFEVRLNDRNFRVGDELLLKEFVPKGYYGVRKNENKFTGRILHRRIDYILEGGQFGIEKDYVVMSLSLI